MYAKKYTRKVFFLGNVQTFSIQHVSQSIFTFAATTNMAVYSNRVWGSDQSERELPSD